MVRFAVGPVARSPLAWLLVAAAALPLMLGRGPRLVWASRLWVTALASWGLAFAAYRGDMGSFAPSETVVLAPAALAVAACIGLGIAAFENDLSGREFGWRQLTSVAALAMVVLGLLPVLGAAAGGRWGLPAQGVEQPLGFLGRPTPGVARVLWLGDPRALPVGGWSVEPGLAFSLTPEDLPDSAQVLAPAGPGPAALTGDAVRLAIAGGTVHLGRLLAPAGVRYVVVVDGLSPSEVGTATPSVAAPPPAGLQEDLLEQDDLEVVPGEVGVQVYQVSEGMPVTGARGAPLPPVHTWSYPAAADVVGWQPVLGDLSQGDPATGIVPAGTVYAGYAPAGSFTLTRDGRVAPRQPAFGWAAQYGGVTGHASLTFSSFPYVPLVVLLEVGAWMVLLVALVGRPRRPRTARRVAEDDACRRRTGARVSPAHRARELRWRILLLVVVVLTGVGIVAATRGTPTAPAAPAAPGALVSAPDAESSAWYCTGQSSASGPAPGFLVLTNSLARPVSATVATVSDGGASARTAVSVPAHGVATPNLPAMSSGSWQAEAVTVDGGGVAVSQVVHGSSGWDESPCQSNTSSHWYIASGTTANGDGLYLSLFNPTATPVVVDLSFVTEAGSVHPVNYQGIVLDADSVLAENVASEIQDVAAVSTVVTTRTGRVVASEVQSFAAPSNGLSLVPGVATPQAHWTIPQAEEATGATTAIEIFNPGTTPETVTARVRVPSGALAPLSDTVAPGTTWSLITSQQTRIPVGSAYSTDIVATGGPGVVVGRTVVLSASAPAAQAGIALAVDGLSQKPSGGAWLVPPPGTSATPAIASAAPTSLAVTNTSAVAQRYSAQAVTASGQTALAAGSIAPGDTVFVTGSALAQVAFDPIVVRAEGTLAVSEDVGPSGGIGVVTMPGIPLAGTIAL